MKVFESRCYPKAILDLIGCLKCRKTTMTINETLCDKTGKPIRTTHTCYDFVSHATNQTSKQILNAFDKKAKQFYKKFCKKCIADEFNMCPHRWTYPNNLKCEALILESRRTEFVLNGSVWIKKSDMEKEKK